MEGAGGLGDWRGVASPPYLPCPLAKDINNPPLGVVVVLFGCEWFPNL